MIPSRHAESLKTPPSGKRINASAQLAMKADIRRMFADMTRALTAMMVLRAGSDGIIDLKEEETIRREARVLVERYFVNPSPFARDGVTPLSPFARILTKYYVRVVGQNIRKHHDWLKANTPELYTWLSGAQLPEGLPLSEAITPRAALLKVDPFRKWVPMDKWTDANGYRLSDRIWKTSDATRQAIEDVLAESIRVGRSSTNTAKILAKFLNPDAALVKTYKPYNRRASFSAMRLARTEITRANNQAAVLAARLNPYVDRADVVRSKNGDKSCQVCPEHSSIDIQQNRVRDPYPVDDVEGGPFHPHCVTPGQLVATHRGNIPIEQVVAGDYVLTHRGMFRQVKHAWGRQYTGKIHRIITASGECELTSEHPVLLANGWLNAEDVQAGNQILHTSINIPLDSVLSVADGYPTESGEVVVSPGIPFGFMPAASITLNSNLAFEQGEIQHVAPETILPLINDTGSIQRAYHQFFNRGRNAITSVFEYLRPAKSKTGVMALFSLRNLSSYFRSLSRIVVTADRIKAIGATGCFAGNLSACAIIFAPDDSNSITAGSHGNSQKQHNPSEAAVLNTQPLAQFGISKFLRKIPILNKLFDRYTELNFDTTNVFTKGKTGETLTTPENFTADTTINAESFAGHDNLLSSSPDILVGAASGSAVVNEVANLVQAHQYYTRIEQVITDDYTGMVYNMEVEGDNSYTVGGLTVHNCMCHIRPLVTDNPAEVTAQLTEQMRQNQPAPMTPAALNKLLRWAFGAYQFGQWLNQDEAA